MGRRAAEVVAQWGPERFAEGTLQALRMATGRGRCSYLLPPGEGGRDGRMRVTGSRMSLVRQARGPSRSEAPHPPLRGTFSRGEKVFGTAIRLEGKRPSMSATTPTAPARSSAPDRPARALEGREGWVHVCNGLDPIRDGGMVPSILGMTGALAAEGGRSPS